jgi:hypothetical protein
MKAKWTFKTTEVDLSEDEVRISFSKQLEQSMNDLLTAAFGIAYLQAEKIEVDGMISINFRADLDDIETFQDALTCFYMEKYDEKGLFPAPEDN